MSGNPDPRWTAMTAMVEVNASELCWAVECLLHAMGRPVSRRREFANALQKLIDEFRTIYPEASA